MERVPYNDTDFVVDNSTAKGKVSTHIHKDFTAGEIVTLVLSVLGYPAGGFARQVLTSNGLSSLFVAGDSFGYCEETSVDVIDEG